MNVMIPLGGIGSRFQKEGYKYPKPFVRVLGKEMILWVVDSLKLRKEDSLVVVYNPAFLDMRELMEMVVQHVPGTILVELPGPTRGAAETVRIGLEGLSASQRSRPTMLVDGDAFYTVDIVSMYRAISATSGGSFCFRDTQPKPIYSYVTCVRGVRTIASIDASRRWRAGGVDVRPPRRHRRGRVTRSTPSPRPRITHRVGADGKQITSIKEKVKISDWANTGCYCFRDGQQLLKYCAQIIERGETQLSQDMKGEFYTSGVIKAMLDDGERFEALTLDKEAMHVLGTPAQLKDFCRKWPKPTAYRVCFDLDNTLFGPPEVSGDYSTCRPIPRAVRMCRHLKQMGHHIILHTARRMRTHGANVGAVVADVGAVTIQSLQDAGIEYDELHFGKPWAQFYIDDCGVNAYADLEKELGYYPPTSAAVASKYVPSPVASTPPSVVGRVRHSSTTVALAAALGVAVGVLAARK